MRVKIQKAQAGSSRLYLPSISIITIRGGGMRHGEQDYCRHGINWLGVKCDDQALDKFLRNSGLTNFAAKTASLLIERQIEDSRDEQPETTYSCDLGLIRVRALEKNSRVQVRRGGSW